MSAPEHDTVIELRQYTLHSGQRDTLIDIFDGNLVEGQEDVGMRILGQFRDLDNPDRFVWLRSFSDMPARADALEAFYTGPVWRAHSREANATMVDSDNVLLLRPLGESGFNLDPHRRAPLGATSLPTSLVVATLYYSVHPIDDDIARFFDQRVQPAVTAAGATPIAYFETEPAENTFPALPVRTGEFVFAWFSLFASHEQHRDYVARLGQSDEWTGKVQPDLVSRLVRDPEVLRLAPTTRSLLH
jgi:hypothetical protein